jgi:hypothetical protein
VTAIKEVPDYSRIVQFAEILKMKVLPILSEGHILSNHFTTSGYKHLMPILYAVRFPIAVSNPV